MNMLKGKTALVTGSTSGIGLAIAICLAHEGANILMNGFGDQDEPMNKIKAIGVDVDYHHADMSKPNEIVEMMAMASERFGGVDILVNNAGIQHTALVEDFPLDKWDAIIAINLSSAFHTTRLALPHMRLKNWGRIINLASVHGLIASPQKAAYVAAKHGIVGLTKVVALETAKTNITCNAICPGWVLTPLVQRQIDDYAVREGVENDVATRMLISRQPSNAFVKPEQLGALVVFLCSAAAQEVRGVAWNMDGGFVAQ